MSLGVSRNTATLSPFILLIAGLVGHTSSGAEIPKVPVPNSPYIKVVYAYADTMLERGRDTYGPQKTDLFLSALDRANLQALTNRPPAPAGVREADRAGEQALAGCNPQHDENLLRLLYTLSELSAKAKYREAADAELKWLLENSAFTNAHVFPRVSWDVIKDQPILSDANDLFRPWMLWDRCFQVAPEASKQATVRSIKSRPSANPVRESGFHLRSWAVATAKTKDNQFLSAIESAMNELEKQKIPLPDPSLAIDCDGAAHHLPNPLAGRLRTFAARQDELFLSLPHKLKETGGFITGDGGSTSLWNGGGGRQTTAQVAMMCVSRYDNTGKTGYRSLITDAANAYLNSLPNADVDAWPRTFGQAISLEVAAWRHTADIKYFERARKLADFAIEKFLDKSLLPRASLKSEHYEAITGADTLMLALLELHLHVLHITAVRYPPNTIDR